jgi:hypothetical protein
MEGSYKPSEKRDLALASFLSALTKLIHLATPLVEKAIKDSMKKVS